MSDAPTTRLTARLVFADTGAPLHHVHVRVVARDFLLPDEHVGDGETDTDGVLDVSLSGRGVSAHHLGLRLQVSAVPHGIGDMLPDDRLPHWPATDCHADLHDGVHEAGTVRVAFWPYRQDWKLPRSRGADGKHDEPGCAQVRDLLLEQKAKWGPTLAAHVATSAPAGFPQIRSVADIQAAYPESLTQTVDAADPGRSRSDEWIGHRVLDGIYPLLLGRDRDDPDLLRWKMDWGEVRSTGTYDLTDVDASFRMRDGLPMPVRIALRVRRPTKGGWVVEDERVFTPDDDEWDAAKRVFRVQYLLAGEIDAHMTMSHIRVEQYGVALRRNLRRNPVAVLLGPHLREVCATNDQADMVAWGPVSATVRGSTFGTDDIQARMQRTAGREDWLSWRPRRPLSDKHAFARGAALFWELLTEHVDEFLADNGAGVESEWIEIRRFSDDLVAHSAPYLPPENDPSIVWDDENERPDADSPRVDVGGALRSAPPVTTSDTPADGDMERLAQLCRYVIFHATYWHAWVHDRQYEDGGEIRYASLALRNGSLGAEDDDDIAPAPLGATLGLGTITIGCAVQYGYLVANEDGDVPPGLRERLLARRDAFDALGIDVERIRARINI